jgi:hypothetical protein
MKISSEPVRTVEFSQRAKSAPGAEEPVSRRIGPGEVVLAGILALGGYTALLLRLPYRMPMINILAVCLALSSFYFYLRLRLDIRVPFGMIGCLVLSIALDVIGNQFGLFSRRIALIPYDIITHFSSSGLSFIPVMWLLMTFIRRFGYRLPLGFVAFFSATTTFTLAGYYEITELMDERFFGGHRIWTPRDTVQDLSADLAGIVIAAICYGFAVRAQWRRGYSKLDHPC